MALMSQSTVVPNCLGQLLAHSETITLS